MRSNNRKYVPILMLTAIALSSCRIAWNVSISNSESESTTAKSIHHTLEISMVRTIMPINTSAVNGLGFTVTRDGFDCTLNYHLRLAVFDEENFQYETTEKLQLAGNYTLRATYGQDSVSATFVVYDPDDDGNNGSATSTSRETDTAATSIKYEPAQKFDGYYLASDSFRDYNVGNYDYLGVLGPYNLPNKATDGNNPQILVIPIYFSNGKAPSAFQMSSIDAAFFGNDDETGWKSLKSYYKEASYGILNIGGAVADAVRMNVTDTEAKTAYNNGKDESGILTKYAVEQVRKNQPELFSANNNFDSNGDGYIDGVEVIYMHKTYAQENDQTSDFFWAYTSTLREELSPNTSMPNPDRYFFASYYQIMSETYFDKSGKQLPDAHTLIHENGHMLGINDYYDYSQKSGPAGLGFMMDMNVGDLDPYSKMLVGWTKPYVVDGSSDDFSITLRPFEETGDTLIVKTDNDDDFNGTPYDDYLVLSYYTPTGLNEQDSRGYSEWNGYGNGGPYSESGLQVYHVDSRAVNVTYKMPGQTVSSVSFTDNPLKKQQVNSASSTITISTIGQCNNTPTADDYNGSIEGSWDVLAKTQTADRRQLTAIPSDGSRKFFEEAGYYDKGYMNYLGTTGTLFTTKSGYDTFDPARYTSYFRNKKFNDGTSVSWKFTVTSMDSDGITVHFTLA